MPNDYILYTLLVISATTILLRSVPFFFIKSFQDSELLTFISKKMPIGIMSLLIIYTLKDESYLVMPFGIPILTACALSIFLYWRYKSAILSIFTSLFLYLFIMNYELLLSI